MPAPACVPPKLSRRTLLLGGLLTLLSATGLRAEEIRAQFLQINDIYEITPVSAGREGGVARIATLRRQLLQQNPQTVTVLAGDLFSPSALGTARWNGQRLAGAQMVASLNALGLDYATFGNHEFDLQETEFLARLKESRFGWVSTNVDDARGEAFPGVKRSEVLTFWSDRCRPVPRPNDCRPLRIGLVGVTLNSNKVPYIRYRPPQAAIAQVLPDLQSRTDAVIALTHLNLEDDRLLAQSLPDLKLLMGGHDHDNSLSYISPGFRPLAKADANGRSVYLHELRYDTISRDLSIRSRLMPVADPLPEDPAVAAVVRTWVERGRAYFATQGMQMEAIIGDTPIPLDGRSSTVRSRSNVLTERIAAAMRRSWPEAEAALFNSGSIRIDDWLPAGPVSQYDLLRVLPFGGRITQIEMRGELLQLLLIEGWENMGNGGFLQWSGITRQTDGNWRINGEPINSQRWYRIAISDYLLTGAEQDLGFLTRRNPDLRVLAEGEDVRQAVIRDWKDFRPHP
jgi:5'-nucleotidase